MGFSIQTSPGKIYSRMSDIQRQIATDGGALKFTGTLLTVKDQVDYDLDFVDEIADGIYKITNIITPAAWTNWERIIENPRDWADHKRDTTVTSSYPLKAYVYGRVLKFHPAPTADDEEVELWGIVDLGEEIVISETVPPVLPLKYDDALEFGTSARLLGPKDQTYEVLYRDRMLELEAQAISGQAAVPIQRDYKPY